MWSTWQVWSFVFTFNKKLIEKFDVLAKFDYQKRNFANLFFFTTKNVKKIKTKQANMYKLYQKFVVFVKILF